MPFMPKSTSRVTRILMGASLLVAAAAPSFAGTVYSWVTEDGTHAFTDDPKRIPAMHKAAAQARPMGDLKRYERYTVDRTGKAYVERLRQRQSDLRAREVEVALPSVAAGPSAAGAASSLTYGIPMNGGRAPGNRSGAGLQLPLSGNADPNSDEPITVESVRMQPTSGSATRHYTIVKQGDRIITVIKGENRDRSPEGFTEQELGIE